MRSESIGRLSRRAMITAAVAAAVGVGGCKEETKEKTKIWAYTGIQIGLLITKIPHPAAKIVGVVLAVSGMLVVTYLTVEDQSQQTVSVQLTPEQASKLDETRRVTLIKKYGTKEDLIQDKGEKQEQEERSIDRVASPGDRN